MKVATNFYIWEFVSEQTYNKWGNKSIWFVDKRLVVVTQELRVRIGLPITGCNWHDPPEGGPVYNWSGYRPPDCEVGADESQHRFGRGIDLKILGEENRGADILREEIEKNWKSIYRDLGLTRIESAQKAPNWCHLDLAWTGVDYLVIF